MLNFLRRSSNTTAPKEQDKIRYYTASQWQLVWQRFKRNRLALIGAFGLSIFLFITLFAGFLAPYPVDMTNSKSIDQPPSQLRFCDHNGCSLRPFVYGTKTERNPVTLASETVEDPEIRVYLKFFVRDTYGGSGWNLYGIDDGFIYLFGTDSSGRDMFSRLMFATRTSMTIGVMGVLLAFVLGLTFGGIAGYFGGRTDFLINRMIEFVRTVPAIPVAMGAAAAFPKEWSSKEVFFATTLILGLLGWTTLARRVRGQLLATRKEDFVLSARLSGSSAFRIITRHLLPSFTSYIIVDLVVSFPYMILLETALSFVQLGLRPPDVSWGILLEGQPLRKITLTPWQMTLPLLFVFTAVLSFVLLGDGLRDAADPYNN